MKVAKFIAGSGFNTAIALLMNMPETASHYSNDDGYYYEEWSHNGWVKSVNNQWVDCKKGKDLICLSDLKIYVDAWELVQVHGLEQSNEIVNNAPSDEHFYSWTLGNSGVKDKTVNIGELRKAIALVEEVECLKEVS